MRPQVDLFIQGVRWGKPSGTPPHSQSQPQTHARHRASSYASWSRAITWCAELAEQEPAPGTQETNVAPEGRNVPLSTMGGATGKSANTAAPKRLWHSKPWTPSQQQHTPHRRCEGAGKAPSTAQHRRWEHRGVWDVADAPSAGAARSLRSHPRQTRSACEGELAGMACA